MDVKKTISNVAVAFLAQGVSMLISLFQSLIIPKLLGLEQFGYWQLFVFYVGYVGLFHFGLNDGVYLITGGQSRDEIDKRFVKSQLVISLLYETAIAVSIIIIAINSGLIAERRFVIVCAAVVLVIQNVASYMMFVLQAMNETKLSSLSSIVARVGFFIPMLALLVFRIQTFEPLVVAYCASIIMQLLYCSWYFKDILAVRFAGFVPSIVDAWSSIKIGVKLMLANLASQLVLGVLRAAVDAKWGVETFGQLSLSLSLVSFFLAFVSQAAMVLFPALRQSGEDEVKKFYGIARDSLGLLFPFVYLLYFPLEWVLALWLPAYADGLRYFVWLIPICVFDSKMSILCTTIFKVRRQESLLLGINIAATLACATLVFVSVNAFESVELAIASTTVVIACRSLVSERIVSGDLDVPPDAISIPETLLTVAFVVSTLIFSFERAMLVYLAIYACFLFLQRRRLRRVISLISCKFT